MRLPNFEKWILPLGLFYLSPVLGGGYFLYSRSGLQGKRLITTAARVAAGAGIFTLVPHPLAKAAGAALVINAFGGKSTHMKHTKEW